MQTPKTDGNQLVAIVKESGLESSKATYILENFQSYFEIAAEWEAKAKTLVVTNPYQTVEMDQAREGRLFLREKRIAIENSRKKLKEEALREGKAIDGIANVLKALIVPIEEYLDRQEHFVEIEQEKKEAVMRLEIEQRMAKEEEDRIKKDAEERERLRAENERLAKENAEKDRRASEEKKKTDAKLAVERAKVQAEKDKADQEKVAIEEKAQIEIKVIEKKAAIEKKKADDERWAAEEKAHEKARKEKEKLAAERKERECLEELLKRQIECPKCHFRFRPKGK